MDAKNRVDFFLSRRGSVAAVAQEVTDILADQGYKVIVQDYDIPLDSNFIERIHEAIVNARDLIILFTRDYEESPYTRKEFTSFEADRLQSSEDRKIIILRCDDVPLRGLFAPCVYQDLVGVTNREDRRSRIIAAIKGQSQACKPPPRPFVGVPERNWNFTGRDAEFDNLDAILLGNKTAVVTQQLSPVAVQGMGGVGKTSLATEYAHRYRDVYAGVWWIPAETRAGLLTSLAELGVELDGNIANESDIEKISRAALKRLSQIRAVWLLVYDNVTEPKDIRSFLPSSGARVLITSRFRDWAGLAKELRLDVLTVDEAVSFLQKRVGVNDESGAATLAKAVGYLPLALDHTAAYCKLTNSDFSVVATEVNRLIEKTPRGAAYPHSISATFDLAIREASRRHDAADYLVGYLAQCAPERVPVELVVGAIEDKAAVMDALQVLMEVSLVNPDNFPDGSRAIVMHRLVQEVARHRTESRAIGRLVEQLSVLFPSDINAATWPKAAKLMPHLLSVLHRVREDDFHDREEKNSLDHLARLVVFALLFATDHQREEAAKHIIPEYLARVLGCYYEVEPLSGALDMLLRHHRKDWPRLQQQLLSANNYVLRFAMATALAKACLEIPPAMEIAEVAELVNIKNDLNTFELGGYALDIIYANKPEVIDCDRLRLLANHPCYPGRSILGDMMLNLVLQGYKPHEWLDSERFWKPIWDHVATDVWVIEAAEPFMAGKALPDNAAPAVRDAYAGLQEIEEERQILLNDVPAHATGLLDLLRGYFKLGLNTKAIWDAREEISALPTRLALVQLLFVHPVWSVGEAAASVLADLVRRRTVPISIVSEMFDDTDLRYGAIETSYQLRNFDKMASFTDAVHRFYAETNGDVRALCAENILAEILNRGGDEQARSIQEFEREIRAWLTDENCWVLEHVHRFFNSLYTSGVKFFELLSHGVSRLFDDKPDWYKVTREEFLRHLDTKKQGILDAISPPVPR